MSEQNSRPNEKPLESWKEIAGYLKRDVRTVVRWEKEEKLPVRRHHHKSRSSVYAYPSELEAWKAAREPGFDSAPPVPPWRRPALGLTFAMLLALVSVASSPVINPLRVAAQDADGMVARRVWERAADITGGPSPDGRYLTYVDWDTGDLALRDLKTGKNRRLTNKGSWSESTEFALYPTISPSGKQVAYTWFNKDFSYDLRLVGLDGSDPRVLYRNEEVEYLQPAAWSPDGEHILATFSRSDRTNQIVLVSVADGSVRVLKTLDWRWPGTSFSPDGRTIAYSFPPQEDSPNRDIFLLATDGSREVPLVTHPADDRSPAWAPDGKRIVFASDRTGTLGAWVIQVAEGKPQGAAKLVKPDMGRIVPMGFTETGSYYYGLSTGMKDVYVATLDLKTGKLLTPSRKATQRFIGSNYAPAWSPDGQYLAYISQRGHSRFGQGSRIISIRSVKTGEERELSPNLNRLGHRMHLPWSPDGRSFLVNGQDKKNRWGIFQIDAQTGDVTTIVQNEPGGYTLWVACSPDGEAIYYTGFHVTSKSSRILVRDLQTGQEQELYRVAVPSFVSTLALSPDGRLLAFVLMDYTTRSTALMVMPAGGGEPRELLRMQEPEHIALFGGITWTPDGREVIFGKGRKLGEVDTTELWRISAQGGEAQRLGLAIDGLRHLGFHPDGRQIAFSAGSPFGSEVWVMENFLPKSDVQTARLEE